MKTLARDGRTLLRACDRGPGVPEAARERRVELFCHLLGHTQRAGSVGLGLGLAQQIAEGHGGSVRGEAGEGGSSGFVLSPPGA